MADDQVRLDFNPYPDAYGFIYGQVHRGDAHYNVNIMPPKYDWKGQFKLEGYEPHDSDWILYVDGEEVGRVKERAGVEREFTRVLLEG
jgi:hypothetical protein